MSLTKRLLATASKNSRMASFADSTFGDKEVLTTTDIKVINLMLSGDLDGGVTSGVTLVVGDSRSYKSLYCIQAVKAFMDKYDDAVCLFFDSEGGASKSYFTGAGISLDRVIHVPVLNIEEMKFDLAKMLGELTETDKVIVFIDSISQVPSKREVENAVDGNSAADMSRAAALNSFWRIITPQLNDKHIPLFAINSYYDDMGNKYAEKIIKGGKQGFLSSDTILFVTRSQEKDADKNLFGFTFNYRVLKSRFVREGSKFPMLVTFDEGISKYSGIFDLAKDAKLIDSPKQGWYKLQVDIGMDMDKSYRRNDLDCEEVLNKICNLDAFKIYCNARYKLNYVSDMKVDIETGEILAK